MVIRRKIGMLRSRYVFLESRRSWKQGIVRARSKVGEASRGSVINRVAFSLWETEKGAGPAGERIENDGCGVFAGEDPVEGNVYRGEERAKSFGSALTHFLRGSVKRAHFATAKLISPFPPRDSLPFFPFSSSLFPFSSPFFGRHNGRTNGRKSTTGEKLFARLLRYSRWSSYS